MKKQTNKKSNKSIILGIIITLLVMIALIGLTYAYYRTKIIGNSNEKSISTVNKKLELVYSDDNAILEASDTVPGTEYEKDFQVTNNGDETDYFSIKIENVENTFDRREDWTYTIYKLNSEEDTILEESKVIKSGMLPNTESWLVYKEEIGSGDTQYYKLKIEYIDLEDIDQSEDMGKTLSFKINIDGEIDNEFTKATGNTLLAAIARDNTISEPLTKLGEPSKFKYYDKGMDNTIKKVSITTENQLLRYYTYASSYTFDEEKGTYKLVNPEVGLYSEIYNELIGKYVVNVNGVEDSNVANSTNLSTIYKINNATTAITNTIQYVASEKTTYGMEKELSYAEDDYGTSYYYRGDVTNNYVNFGSMCWKIVRVQGDGSIKIVLEDENNECNGEGYDLNNLKRSFINNGEQIEYGAEVDSKIPKFSDSNLPEKLKTWMETKKILENDNIKQDAEWCMYSDVSSGGRPPEPRFGCNFPESEGPAKVIEVYRGKVALLTAGEVSYAGAAYGAGATTTVTFLPLPVERNRFVFLMTVGYVNSTSNNSFLYYLAPHGWADLAHWSSPWRGYVRPAIVLRSTVVIQEHGNGTQNNPYVIE